MRCEELEPSSFPGGKSRRKSGRKWKAHAKTCEACRALMDNADALRGMQRIDEDVTPPESFTKGWRMAIRQTPRVISISDWMRREGVRVVGYAACAALVFAAGTGVGRLGGSKKKTRRGRPTITTTALMIPTKPIRGRMRSRFTRTAPPALGARSAAEKGRGERQHGRGREEDRPQPWLTLKTERFDEAVSAPASRSSRRAALSRAGTSAARRTRAEARA